MVKKENNLIVYQKKELHYRKHQSNNKKTQQKYPNFIRSLDNEKLNMDLILKSHFANKLIRHRYQFNYNFLKSLKILP